MQNDNQQPGLVAGAQKGLLTIQSGATRKAADAQRSNSTATYSAFQRVLGSGCRRNSLDEGYCRPIVDRGCGKCRQCRRASTLLQRYANDAIEDPLPSSTSHLILHFDINKTILITDKVKNADLSQMINVLLSSCAWGRLVPGPAWRAVGRLATDKPQSDPELMTFTDFLDSFLLPYRQGHGNDVAVANTAIRKQRHVLKSRFTEPGEPGAMFRSVFDELVSCMKVPDELADHPLYGGLQQRRILPSFFELLILLQKQKKRFTVVFRTFGSDLEDVMDEMNAFATGNHPEYPHVRMDGSDGLTDLRCMDNRQQGFFYREGPGPNDTHLLLGASKKVLGMQHPTKQALEAILPLDYEHEQRAPSPVRASSLPSKALPVVHDGLAMQHGLHDRDTCYTYPRWAHGFQAIGREFRDMSRRRNPMNTVYCFRDYFPFWRERNERAKAGKLLLVDDSDPSTIEIFFDDNVGHGSPHIVDVRYLSTGKPALFSAVKGKHLLRVEPLNAILDSKYFIRAVAECEYAVMEDRSSTVSVTSNAGGLSGSAVADGVGQSQGLSSTGAQSGSLTMKSEESGGGLGEGQGWFMESPTGSAENGEGGDGFDEVFGAAFVPSPLADAKGGGKSSRMVSQAARVSLAAKLRWIVLRDHVLSRVRLRAALME